MSMSVKSFGIAKKDFHELIINVIKMRRYMIRKIMMARALDILMMKEEEDDIK